MIVVIDPKYKDSRVKREEQQTGGQPIIANLMRHTNPEPPCAEPLLASTAKVNFNSSATFSIQRLFSHHRQHYESSIQVPSSQNESLRSDAANMTRQDARHQTRPPSHQHSKKHALTVPTWDWALSGPRAVPEGIWTQHPLLLLSLLLWWRSRKSRTFHSGKSTTCIPLRINHNHIEF